VSGPRAAKVTVASSMAFACWPAHARSAMRWVVSTAAALGLLPGERTPDLLIAATRPAGGAPACSLGMGASYPRFVASDFAVAQGAGQSARRLRLRLTIAVVERRPLVYRRVVPDGEGGKPVDSKRSLGRASRPLPVADILAAPFPTLEIPRR
jgi:hypothetical protein